jgi:hypothetical protein
LKGQRDKDSIDPRSTIQSLFLEIFERDKSGIQNIAAQNHSRSTIESSFAQVLCQQRCANYRYFFSWGNEQGNGNEKNRSPRSYHPKFVPAAV